MIKLSTLLISITIFIKLCFADRPNILFILADDLGHANVGYHNNNNPEIKTPNIDYLVTNGLEITRHYVHYVCSPTRSSIHSGRLPVHCNLDNGEPGDIYVGVPSNYTILAEKLKSAQYSTAYFGKWHAGATLISQMPYNRGYDKHIGYLWGMNDYWNQHFEKCGNTHIVDIWNNDKPANTLNSTQYEEFIFSQHIYDLINESVGSIDPFFIFYAAHLGHSPLQIPKEYLTIFDNDEYLCCNFTNDETKPNPIYPGYNGSCETYHCRSIYQSMVNLLDIIVGNITHLLKQNNLWNNTLIIFSSDNGGQLTLDETAANNYPLRGGKFVPFEGGIRVNAFVSGGYLPNNRRGKKTNPSEMMHVTDWYHTICALIGIDPTDYKAQKAGLPPIDSLNMLDFIMGRNDTSPRTELLVDKMTLIQNNWKFINSTGVNFNPWGCKTNQLCYASWGGPISPNSSSMTNSIQNTVLDCNGGCLFDVGGNDMTEHFNQINYQNSSVIVQNMNQRLIELRKGIYQNNEGGESLCPQNISENCQCYMALETYSGFWGPFHSP